MKLKLYSTTKAKEFSTKGDIIRYFLSDHEKIPALLFLSDHIKSNRYKTVLSLGSGCCVLEYLLKLILPETDITATDIDEEFMNHAKRFFPEINAEVFDFVNDNPKKFNPDLAVFFGASYVMDDSDFVRVLRNFNAEIIDFHSTLTLKKALIVTLSGIRKKGRFHGYARTKGEMRKLYHRAGLEVIKEKSLGCYNHIVVVRRKC